MRIFETNPYSETACLTRSLKFNKFDRYKEYVDIYKER